MELEVAAARGKAVVGWVWAALVQGMVAVLAAIVVRGVGSARVVVAARAADGSATATAAMVHMVAVEIKATAVLRAMGAAVTATVVTGAGSKAVVGLVVMEVVSTAAVEAVQKAAAVAAEVRAAASAIEYSRHVEGGTSTGTVAGLRQNIHQRESCAPSCSTR